jgi:LysR family nitrogen assimilation transcriptional regulator
MELRQLRYFVAIVDHGSLSRRRVLHIAQPALTQQIRQLGGAIASSFSPGVIATDAGKVFYEHALAILKQVQDAKQAVAQSTDKPLDGAGHSAERLQCAGLPLLNAVRSIYPEITLQLTEELTGNLITQLKSGRINLAVLLTTASCLPSRPRP